MTANVEIFTGEKHDVLRVANEALRFKPSVIPAEILNEPPRVVSGRNNQFIERFKAELELTDAQAEALQAEFSKMREQAMAGRQSGGGIGMGPPPANGTNDRLQARQRMEAALDKVMKDILTDEQWAKYEAGKSARANVRRVKLWVLGADSKLDLVDVFLGLSDDDHTEVIRGLDAGAKVVVREERPRG